MDFFDDFIGSKTYSSTSEYNQTDQVPYEQIKQLQMQSVLDKIELDIHENTNNTIKRSINDLDQIISSSQLIRNPKQKINSLPTKKTSVNSFVTPFYEEESVITEVKDSKEDDRRIHLMGGKSWTTPPFFKSNTNKVFNFGGYNQFLPPNPPFERTEKPSDLRVKSSSPKEEIPQDFDPASYVNPQFVKGCLFFKKIELIFNFFG